MKYDFLIPYYRLSDPLGRMLVTQNFGDNRLPIYQEWGMKGHNGIDYDTEHGTPLYAPIDGEIIQAGRDKSGGIFIKLQADPVTHNGVTYRPYFIHYHLLSVDVVAGERVNRGMQIALCDNTGYSTGDHLHFGMKVETLINNTWVNQENNNGYFGAINPEPFFTYMAKFHNPYGIPNNTLITLRDGDGGQGLYVEDKDLGAVIFDDEPGKLVFDWAIRNKGVGNTMEAVQVIWDAYPRYNLKREKLSTK